ncbi:aminoacyl-tRNA deacylase [Lapidilactobacillus gannanensis]|jgi:Cys-tRNA(Pro)/Cys-tRNA(Cys) deacylase|uniref:Cys-tRNA(Pro)/Cys-tRNA(Cys) deacylase n=1 Tax=Lapidilactobacillus gannanensis TaxID=2486002 RepID=A0ABW4BNV2_9LACO|nr:aminoacyl-tRNA deacylase [Lapidilactobacillus gannanensis]MCH4057533.1 aminoacyl-tRNA deacylase [Lactobacillaceae bacterium]
MSKRKTKLNKTLVEKILDQAKIPYESLVFKLGEQQGTDAEYHRVYKTLVLHGDKTGPLVGVIPIDQHLDERKLAQASGNKRVRMLPLKELEKTTGYVHGANTPVGIHERHDFPIYFDQQATQEADIAVSAGKLGRSIKVEPTALIKFVDGQVADLVVDP